MASFIDLKKQVLGLTKLFQSFELRKIKRQANSAAHEIANFSFDSRSNGILDGSVPPSGVSAIMNDCKNVLLN